jgi:hypothetical protein
VRRARHELRENLDDASGTNAASHVNRQALARPFIHDGQALQRLVVRAPIEDEVIGPDVIGRGGRQRPWSTHRGTAARATAGHLESRLAPEPVRAIGAHHVALAFQEDSNPAIPISRVLRRESMHRDQRRGIPDGQARLIPEGRTRDRQQGARAAA